MDRDAFWSVIDRTRAGTGFDPGKHEQALREALKQVPPAELMDFERHASELLARSFGTRLWGAAYLVNGGCSDDGFDYFRGWLVAQGREVYEAAVANPDSLADYPGLGDGDVELEGLWYIARQEYARATGSEMSDDVGRLESGAEVEADLDFEEDVDFDDDEAMRAHYPRLFARFAE